MVGVGVVISKERKTERKNTKRSVKEIISLVSGTLRCVLVEFNIYYPVQNMLELTFFMIPSFPNLSNIHESSKV